MTSDITTYTTTYPEETRILDDSLFMRWIMYLDAKPKTAETYSKAVRQFGAYLIQSGVTQPSRDTILEYRDHLKATYKATTVQSYMAAVRLFFSWTESEGLYPNIAIRVKGAKIDRAYKKDYLTSKQAGRLLRSIDRSSLKGKRDYAMLSLMLTTGLRTISVARANVEDIRTVGDSIVLYHQGKGRDDRNEYVKLPDPVEEALQDYLRARGEVGGPAPLFCSVAHRNAGGRMTTRSVSRVAKEHLKGIGLDSDRLTAHSFRHTAATLNLLNGGTIEETQQLLGHSNISTTMTYTHILERAKNQSEARIAKAIFR